MVATVSRIDTSGLERRLGRLAAAAEPAGLEVARSGADHFVGFMERHAPRDTRRLVRGWIEAGNKAGLPPRPLPPLRQSRWLKRYLEVLDRQVELYIEEIEERQGILDAWYHQVGKPPDAFYRRKVREIDRYIVKLRKAVEQLRRAQRSRSPILFFAGADAVSLKGKNIWRDVRRRASTIRDKIYGGDGFVLVRDGVSSVVLHNKEPHLTLVERRDRLVGRARAAVRQFTDADAKRTFLSRLEK